jgi:hypothetical protein
MVSIILCISSENGDLRFISVFVHARFVPRAINALDHKKGEPLNATRCQCGEVEWAKEIVFVRIIL